MERWRTTVPDLLIIHPALERQVVRSLVGDYWPDGDLAKVPAGYREISSTLFDLRAFCREERLARPPEPDPTLPERVREWVDALAQAWGFPEVFEARELNFWAFLRDRLIRWLHEMMAERRMLEHVANGQQLSLIAVGVGRFRRMLLRSLAESLSGAMRPEIAFVDPPLPRDRETQAERRLRKLFYLLQDAWHGVQFLYENLFVRRPKVLLVSDSLCWQRRRRENGAWPRTDVHLESVWREGRRRPLRIYYRTDRYHPDVGVMTGGRLAPTYLRHFLFLLAQTSRGFWEVRNIQRQWSRLKERDGFRQALVFEGLPVAEMIISWLDEATTGSLPTYVRDTRREIHFLRGIRPDVLLLAHEQESNRPILVAARRLGIPTVALQLRPFHDWDHAYLLPPGAPERESGLADRLCVFAQSAKTFLVEKGAFDPSSIVVTGDPRLDTAAPGADPDQVLLQRLRKRWGVEGDRKVIAVLCPAAQCSETLAWLTDAVAGRENAFVLIRPGGRAPDENAFERLAAAVRDVGWVHLDSREAVADWLDGVDLLVTTTWPEVAEGVLHRTPVVFVELGSTPGSSGPDPGSLVRRVRAKDELRGIVEDLLAGRVDRLPADEKWREFVRATYGWGDNGKGGAAQRVFEAAEQMIHGE
jgi:hypothetical protein